MTAASKKAGIVGLLISTLLLTIALPWPQQLTSGASFDLKSEDSRSVASKPELISHSVDSCELEKHSCGDRLSARGLSDDLDMTATVIANAAGTASTSSTSTGSMLREEYHTATPHADDYAASPEQQAADPAWISRLWDESMEPKYSDFIKTLQDRADLSSLDVRVRNNAWHRIYRRRKAAARQGKTATRAGIPVPASGLSKTQLTYRNSALSLPEDKADFDSGNDLKAYQAWRRVWRRERRAASLSAQELDNFMKEVEVRSKRKAKAEASRNSRKAQKPRLRAARTSVEAQRTSASALLASGYQAPSWLAAISAKGKGTVPYASASSTTDTFAGNLEPELATLPARERRSPVQHLDSPGSPARSSARKDASTAPNTSDKKSESPLHIPFDWERD